MKKISIALVEDNPTDLSNLIKHFKETGNVEVKHTFLNGSDFLNFLTEAPVEIDAAVIDFRMPVLNGLETFRNIFLKNPEFKLLLVSHGYYSHVMKDLMAMGTQNYCQKTGDIILRSLPRLIEGKNIYEDVSLIQQWEGLTRTSALQMKDEFYWLGKLSPLDKKIIKLVCLGMSSMEIAPFLNYETSSIEKYRGYILKELELKNSQQLAAWAFANGLITSSLMFHAENEGQNDDALSSEDKSLIGMFRNLKKTRGEK